MLDSIGSTIFFSPGTPWLTPHGKSSSLNRLFDILPCRKHLTQHFLSCNILSGLTELNFSAFAIFLCQLALHVTSHVWEYVTHPDVIGCSWRMTCVLFESHAATSSSVAFIITTSPMDTVTSVSAMSFLWATLIRKTDREPLQNFS